MATLYDVSLTHIPMDRRQALAQGESLPDCTQGAALFADISGFTPLTEALVRELGPRRGADELTYQLNRVYDALIAEVHRYQGSVITFSGDAITCWLDGDDGLRATACALAMQATMAQFAEVSTPSGLKLSLGMKAAIATGPVRRFIVGDPRIQQMDVLAGATLDHMAAGEHQAQQRGEIIITDKVAAHLGDRAHVAEWREEAETGARFAVISGLATPVEPTPWPPLPASALTESQVRPFLLPPVYERLRSGEGRFLAELRPAVALFLRFGGLDYDQDAEAGRKLDAYLRWVQTILAHYEGYMFQLTLGDKGCYLYGAFGAPLVHDDDPMRAVAAALELRAPPPDMLAITGIQIGISRGRMRAGAYGGTQRQTYGVIGDEVNIAARLMGIAQPGQIVISQRIADAVAERYILDYVGPVALKGKREPLPVSLVLGRRQPSVYSALGNRFTQPLIGRERELKQAAHLLDTVQAGEGRILRLEGVAGVGKSHLASEIARHAAEQGLRIIWGTCQSTSQGTAYYVWRHMARALFGLTDNRRKHTDHETQTTDDNDPLARQIAQVEAQIHETNPDVVTVQPETHTCVRSPIMADPRIRSFIFKGVCEASPATTVDIIVNLQ